MGKIWDLENLLLFLGCKPTLRFVYKLSWLYFCTYVSTLFYFFIPYIFHILKYTSLLSTLLPHITWTWIGSPDAKVCCFCSRCPSFEHHHDAFPARGGVSHPRIYLLPPPALLPSCLSWRLHRSKPGLPTDRVRTPGQCSPIHSHTRAQWLH